MTSAARISRSADSGSYRESHKRKGADYHDTFAAIPHRAILWKLEKRVLDRIVRERFPAKKPAYLDFACGTGRILAYLAPRATAAVGVDVSATMLEVARVNVPSASIIEGDITQGLVLDPSTFDLITAFRFFPNAEPALRLQVMTKLAGYLSPGGCLVFNNHMHANSLVRRMLRAVRRDLTDEGLMSDDDVTALVGNAGLRIVATYPLGVLPFTEKRTPGPYWLTAALESAASRMPGANALAQNVIHVCTRAQG